MFFKKNIEEEVSEEELITNYLIIHYTPGAIVLYHFTGEFISADDSATISFSDEEGRTIEIGGTFIILQLNDEKDIPNLIHKYRLKEMNLPIIDIKVTEN